jgi:hypothetical protein
LGINGSHVKDTSSPRLEHQPEFKRRTRLVGRFFLIDSVKQVKPRARLAMYAGRALFFLDRAILAGERNPVTLARLCHSRVKSSEDTVAKSLEGDWPVMAQ